MYEKVSIDLDFGDRERKNRVISKIIAMPCCDSVFCRASFSKGWHLIVFCRTVDCNLCRLVFDDSNRFSMDSRRKIEERDVLWETARMLKGFQIRHTVPEPQEATGRDKLNRKISCPCLKCKCECQAKGYVYSLLHPDNCEKFLVWHEA